MSEVARGGRVHLRHATVADREPFVASLVKSRRHVEPWVTVLIDDATIDAWFASADRAEQQRLFVVRNDDGALAGVLNLSQIFRGPFANAYLGYHALVPHMGKGYLREGLDLLPGYAFGELALHRLNANVQPANVRSIELLRGAGFRLEGVSPSYLHIGGAWRDHQSWVLLADGTPEEHALASSGPVSLHRVTSGGWRDVVAVQVRRDQRGWVSDVATYLTLCRYGGSWSPLAIVAADEVVGFAMWGRDPGDGSYWIGGISIDRRRQGEGLGTAAIAAMVGFLRTMPGCRQIALSYRPDNEAAAHAYAGAGFVATGEVDGDEVVARLDVRRRKA